MNWELESVLEQSISQMAEGKARVESCLLAYPAHAGELGPLLVATEAMLAAPKPVISTEAKARIEGQLFEAAVASGLLRRERKPLKLPRLGFPTALPRWRLAYSALAAVVIVMLLMTTTLVGAANALPGSPLYPVKLATEDVWLWVAPARDEPALHLRFAQRRLQEYQKLAEQGVYDQSVLDAMVAHVDAALQGVADLPPAVALPLLEEAAEVLAEQRVALTGMLADMPAASRPHVQGVLADAYAQILTLDALRSALLPYETGATPELSETDIPTSTAEPGELQAATATEASEQIEQTEEAGEAEATQAIEPTEELAPTSAAPTGAAPTETSVPTATEVPPSATPEDAKPTKETPPGQTKTPQPPGLMTRTPNP